MVRKGILQTEKLEPLGMVLNHAENFFACMIGKAAMETEGKDQVTVEAIKNDEFACAASGIGGGFQNTKEL